MVPLIAVRDSRATSSMRTGWLFSISLHVHHRRRHEPLAPRRTCSSSASPRPSSTGSLADSLYCGDCPAGHVDRRSCDQHLVPGPDHWADSMDRRRGRRDRHDGLSCDLHQTAQAESRCRRRDSKNKLNTHRPESGNRDWLDCERHCAGMVEPRQLRESAHSRTVVIPTARTTH